MASARQSRSSAQGLPGAGERLRLPLMTSVEVKLNHRIIKVGEDL